MAAWISVLLIGSSAFFLVGSTHIYGPYTNNPVQKLYKAYPDYATGGVAFYEKEVRNVIRNL